MPDLPWYPRYGARFIAATVGFSLEEKGAYSLMLDLIYDRGGPIPDDPRYLAGVCGCSVRKWLAIRATLIERGKLFADDGHLMNAKAVSEISKTTKLRDKLAESGAKGGRKRAENAAASSKINGVAQASLKHITLHNKEEEEPSVLCPKPAKRRISYPEDFLIFWGEYPTDANMSKKQAYDAWRRLSVEDREVATKSLVAFKAYCRARPDYRPIHAGRYLTQRRFDGHSETAEKMGRRFRVLASMPQCEAWREHLKSQGTRMNFFEDQVRGEGYLAPSEWPPEPMSRGKS